MIIALDAMGGDFAPANVVQGAIETVKERPDLSIALVGPEDTVRSELASKGYKGGRILIRNASEVVTMDDSPSHAIRRKKDSSLRRTLELVKSGEAAAAVSAGNSGAMMALSVYLLGVSEGVDRPAIAAAMPSLEKPFILLDAGANVDCDANNLFQFALMGNALSKYIHHVAEPRVAILSIGEEPSKGNELTKETFKLLQNAEINFIGNIESKDVYLGRADVVVCDGFVGNIFLKTSEGIAQAVMKMLKREIEGSMFNMLGYIFMRPALKNVSRTTAYDEYGGAPLLGLNGASIICHGRSTPKAIKNAIFKAAEFGAQHLPQRISEDIQTYYQRKQAPVAG